MELENVTRENYPSLTKCPFQNPFGYIYLLTNKETGQMYVGKHKYALPRVDGAYWGGGTRIRADRKKYGNKAFKREVLYWMEHDPDKSVRALTKELNLWERFFIEKLGTFENPNDYNDTRGGDGLDSDLCIGKLNHMYGCKGELDPMYGKRGKDSPWHNKTHTADEKKKISEKLKGRVRSAEHSKNISEAKLNARSEPFYQLTDDYRVVHEFKRYSETKKYGFCPSAVSHVCNGKQEFHQQYRWMFVSDYEQMLSDRKE